jgi:hypothetical protein
MEFSKFPSMARFNKRVIVTEKLDGSNAQIYIGEDGEFLVGSRNKWITESDDNYGFAKWAHDHKEELLTLGPGRHFGEWWGQGIQRRYGIDRKVFSLFNAVRWAKNSPKTIPTEDPRIVKIQEVVPECCDVVPVLWEGSFEDLNIQSIMESLRVAGSLAAPGFMKPEGVIVFHIAANVGFKKTFEKDAGKWS